MSTRRQVALWFATTALVGVSVSTALADGGKGGAAVNNIVAGGNGGTGYAGGSGNHGTTNAVGGSGGGGGAAGGGFGGVGGRTIGGNGGHGGTGGANGNGNGASSLDNNSVLSGGNGSSGLAGTGRSQSGGGGGGAGGYGAIITGSTANSNSSTIRAGTGGSGGTGQTDGSGGGGGDGGVGVLFKASGATLTNTGSVSGGNGGAGGAGGYANGTAGAGGAGIVGSGLTIVNSGSITGGTNGSNTVRANAITFTGGTNTLTFQGSSWSLTGNIGITGGGSVTFNQATDQTLANAITGNGSAIQNGIGTLTLSGANTYTGPTEVAAGRLVVIGSITSNVTVNSGASFGGTGTVTGDVTNNGFVRPDIGTLNITGTYTQNADGTYQVEVTPSGQSDLIAITGNAVLNGGTVAVNADSGTYAKSMRYTILTATGGVTGTFAGVTSNLAFLTPSLSYDADDVFLTLLQSSSAFASGARTGNQYAVGTMLDRANASASGDFATVLSALSKLDTVQGPAALNAISGQPVANFGTANTQTASAFMSAVGAQMSALHGGLGGGTHVAMAAPTSDQACDFVCDVSQPSRYGAWISGVGGLGSALGDSNAGTFTYNFGGTAVGADYKLMPDLLLGIGAGYITGTQWTNGFDGRGTTDAFSGNLYASWTPGNFYVDGLVGYAYSINRLTRTIVIPGLAPRIAQGTTGANQVLGQIEAGYRLALPVPATAAITPFVRLQGSTTIQNGFSESGAQSLDLTVEQQTTDSLRTTIGTDLTAEIRKVAIDIRLGWQHESADTARPMTASFAGAPGQPFTVFGATPQRNSAVLGLAATTHVADATELYARYDGEVGGGTDNHAFTAGLRMTW